VPARCHFPREGFVGMCCRYPSEQRKRNSGLHGNQGCRSMRLGDHERHHHEGDGLLTSDPTCLVIRPITHARIEESMSHFLSTVNVRRHPADAPSSAIKCIRKRQYSKRTRLNATLSAVPVHDKLVGFA